MKKIKQIFEKIIKYFNQIFNKETIKLIEDSEFIKKEEVINSKNIDNNIDKKDFFIIYENIRKGIIKPSDLMLDDLIKLQLVMQEELNIMDNKIEMSEQEILENEQEITSLKKQKDEYILKLKNKK